MPRNDPVVKIDTFFGLRNSDRPERLEQGSLAVAENVDIDDSMTVEIREGMTEVPGLSGLYSLYATRDQNQLFGFMGANLVEIHADMTLTLLQSGFPVGDYHWAEDETQVFFSGPLKGVIRDHQYYPLNIPTPAPPRVEVLSRSSMGLVPGFYQVTSIRRRSDGAEGGAPAASRVEVLESGGALRITAEPGTVFITPVNGEVFYRAFESNGGPVIWDDITLLAIPLEPEQYQRHPAPENTRVIEYHEGKLYVAEGDTIFFSQPFWPHLFNVAVDYIQIQGQVRVLKSTRDGLFIGTSTCLYALVPDESLGRIADYGVPSGYPGTVDPDTGQVWCLTQRGVISFPPFTNHTEDKVSLNPGMWASSSLVDSRGFKRLVSSVRGQDFPHNTRYDR